MNDLIETIARALVDHPEDVSVSEKESDRSITYQLTVHPDDVGKVIGKQGRIAKALRTVVYASATKLEKKVYIDIQ
ncbi:KH domain-containing protein [Bacillus horti]|uniref:RNA-binding protein KhpA n=1 Tax=Caldalkalibacillus horti TaxID=77523 RepID=A0ABT9W287_9BACI|nr:KH domain-containing protein [Bacillus horti]MDQ0167356.1 putative RNA-binding protein YlqC (UPF0109 family) [Bacillus horti]